MQGYAYAEGCRRGYVLRYFGDPEAMEHCGACDVCLGGSPLGAAAAEAGRRESGAPAASADAREAKGVARARQRPPSLA